MRKDTGMAEKSFNPLKLEEIEIRLVDEAGLISQIRYDRNIWTITGPVYPRHVKFMALLAAEVKHLNES